MRAPSAPTHNSWLSKNARIWEGSRSEVVEATGNKGVHAELEVGKADKDELRVMGVSCVVCRWCISR